MNKQSLTNENISLTEQRDEEGIPNKKRPMTNQRYTAYNERQTTYHFMTVQKLMDMKSCFRAFPGGERMRLSEHTAI